MLVGLTQRINELLESFLSLVKKNKVKIKFVEDGTLRRKIEKFSLSNEIQEYFSYWMVIR